MARAIWSGTISFGLLQVPVQLLPAERRVDLHFRLLDSRDKKPIRYERVNADTGEEVPWNEIVKAFEYKKGSYVVLKEDDFKKAAPHGGETVEIEGFVAAGDIRPAYFERPYYLIPPKKGAKGYVLLRETLRDSGYVGIAKVVIRTRQYLAAVLPEGSALMLNLLRFPQELIEPDEFALPDGRLSEYRISAKETDMARKLIESMAQKWKPQHYRDEFRDRLMKVIDAKANRGSSTEVREPKDAPVEGTKVVDFISVLQKSLANKRRTPAASTQVQVKTKTSTRRRKRA